MEENAPPEIHEDVKSWLDAVQRSFTEGIARHEVLAISALFADGSTVVGSIVSDGPIAGQDTFIPDGLSWSVTKPRDPSVDPSKSLAVRFIESHPLPARFVAQVDIDDLPSLH